mmetsp:Transcript_20092/g.35835  ORF Transcript_20092/g.35835 Transcript_20092/m.35835 type:complete len:303 (+) Transcript_20092:148-1056(+)
MRRAYKAIGPTSDEMAESFNNLAESEMKSRFKILVLGDEGTGKSSMIGRLLGSDFKEEYNPTVGMDFKSETLFLGGRITKLKIWDASGHIKFRSLIPQYIRDSDVIVLAYDITRKSSFESVDSWISTIESIRPLHDILLMIVATKADLHRNRCISEQQGREAARKHNASYLETSAKLGDGCKEMFHNIAKKLVPHDSEDQKGETSDNLDLDELEDDEDYYSEPPQSFCCKLCCCLGVFCPCLAFLCDPKTNGKGVEMGPVPKEVIGEVEGGDSPTPQEQHQVFMIDPEDELEDIDDIEALVA